MIANEARGAEFADPSPLKAIFVVGIDSRS